MVILEARRLTKRFGGVLACDQVDIQVREGEIFGLIGPNGSGKTTLLNLINGIFRLTGGEILFRNRRISGLRPHLITRLGIARAFQIPRLFEDLMVKENVLVGRLFGTRKGKNVGHGLREVQEILELVGLGGKSDHRIPEITIADRKRLELARALIMDPKLLLLDEVMAGLNTREVEDLMNLILEVNQRGISVLIIEHVMKAIMGISNRVMVLHQGRRIALGTAKEIAENEEVIKSYLGERFARRDAGK